MRYRRESRQICFLVIFICKKSNKKNFQKIVLSASPNDGIDFFFCVRWIKYLCKLRGLVSDILRATPYWVFMVYDNRIGFLFIRICVLGQHEVNFVPYWCCRVYGNFFSVNNLSHPTEPDLNILPVLWTNFIFGYWSYLV